MIDHRARQTGDALRENRLLLEEGLSFEKATELAKAKRFPVGSVWYWALSSVYGPKDSLNAENS